MSIPQIQQLIAQARLPEALDALQQSVPAHLKNEVLQLQSRLNELQRKIRLNIIAEDEAGLERNKITAAALNLCSQIDTATPAADSPAGKIIIQNAEKIYNIDKIDNANFS